MAFLHDRLKFVIDLRTFHLIESTSLLKKTVRYSKLAFLLAER